MLEKNKILKVHPNDNVLVALQDLAEGQTVTYNGVDYILLEPIAAVSYTHLTLPTIYSV